MTAADVPQFSALTLAELRKKAADLAERAERLRAQQAVTVPTTPTAGALGRAVRRAASQAAEYLALVRIAEERNEGR